MTYRVIRLDNGQRAGGFASLEEARAYRDAREVEHPGRIYNIEPEPAYTAADEAARAIAVNISPPPTHQEGFRVGLEVGYVEGRRSRRP